MSPIQQIKYESKSWWRNNGDIIKGLGIILTILSVIIFCITSVVRCASIPDEHPNSVKKIDNVEAVLVHELENYSVLVSDGKSSKIISLEGSYGNSTSEFIYDIPSNLPCYVEIKTLVLGHGISEGINKYHITFHLHSKEELKGAGWNRSKHRGETTILEN